MPGLKAEGEFPMKNDETKGTPCRRAFSYGDRHLRSSFSRRCVATLPSTITVALLMDSIAFGLPAVEKETRGSFPNDAEALARHDEPKVLLCSIPKYRNFLYRLLRKLKSRPSPHPKSATANSVLR